MDSLVGIARPLNSGTPVRCRSTWRPLLKATLTLATMRRYLGRRPKPGAVAFKS